MKKMLIAFALSASLVTSSAMAGLLKDTVMPSVTPKAGINSLASCTTFATGSFTTVTYKCCTSSATYSGAPDAASWYLTSSASPACPSGSSYAPTASCSVKSPVKTVSSAAVTTSWLPGNTAASSCLIEATA